MLAFANSYNVESVVSPLEGLEQRVPFAKVVYVELVHLPNRLVVQSLVLIHPVIGERRVTISSQTTQLLPRPFLRILIRSGEIQQAAVQLQFIEQAICLE